MTEFISNVQLSGNAGALVSRRLPNGAVVTEDFANPQPMVVTIFPDGTRQVEHYLDHITVVELPDGGRITTFEDRSVVRTFPSGAKVRIPRPAPKPEI